MSGSLLNRFLLVACALALVVGAAATGARAEWQGEIQLRDGVPHALNPEMPIDEDIDLELREVWRVDGDDEEVLLGVVSQFLRDDDGNTYLLDGQLSEIQVFAPDGEHLRTIGRGGEGPGEFQNGSDMFWAPDGLLAVVQAWPGKIVRLTTTGDPGSQYPLTYRGGVGFQVASRGVGDGDRVILSGTAWASEGDQQMQFAYLKAYDDDGQELVHFHEESRPTSYGGWEFQEENFADFQRRWAVAPDGRVAAVLSFDAYRIHIWNRDGDLERVIERPDYEAVKRSSEEIERFQTLYDRFTRWNPGSTFNVSKEHQAISRIMFRDDGSLWVQSSRDTWRVPEGIYTAFEVYDRQGRFVQRVQLLADADAVDDGLFVTGERAFVVTDLYGAIIASLGGDEDDDQSEDEAELISVIAYDFALPKLEMAAGP